MGLIGHRTFRKSKLVLPIFMASIFCFFIPPAIAGTVQICEGSDLPLTLPFGVISGTYELVKGPFSVAAYSQLRLYASISSGSSINVSIMATDSTGKNTYGILDSFELNAEAASGASASKAYECPGRYVVVDFTSTGASTVNTAVFGFKP